MFTGLIQAIGEVDSLQQTAGAARLTITADRELVRRLHQGDSIAVSGVCLTAVELDAQQGIFTADLAAETIARTSLSRLAPGLAVNLELPTPAGTPLGGHIVQGHVDGVGTIHSFDPVVPGAIEETDWRLIVEIPPELARYVVEKGSISIEGISLTVAHIDSNRVEIAIIPHTWNATNLHTLRPGSPVNVEVDVMAKYAERRASVDARGKFHVTVEYLVANGY